MSQSYQANDDYEDVFYKNVDLNRDPRFPHAHNPSGRKRYPTYEQSCHANYECDLPQYFRGRVTSDVGPADLRTKHNRVLWDTHKHVASSKNTIHETMPYKKQYAETQQSLNTTGTAEATLSSHGTFDVSLSPQEDLSDFHSYYASRCGIPVENVDSHWDYMKSKLEDEHAELEFLLFGLLQQDSNSEEIRAYAQQRLDWCGQQMQDVNEHMKNCTDEVSKKALCTELVKLQDEYLKHKMTLKNMEPETLNLCIQRVSTRALKIKLAIQGGEGWIYIEEGEREEQDFEMARRIAEYELPAIDN